MAKEVFREVSFSKKRKEILDKAIEILGEYKVELTLRQLYYQLVARNIIPNTKIEYTKISRLMSDARYAGHVDWNAIADRNRIPYRPSQFENIKELIQCANGSYRLDRWMNQDYYVEVFTEKDALSSILESITRKYHVYLNVNRGYSSVSAYYLAAKRYKEQMMAGKDCVVLYIGDHDPSGLDMVRDIDTRMNEFGVKFELVSIALTKEQIDQYHPPPNPTKFKDPRAKGYMEKFGNKSWEVDALSPPVLHELLTTALEKYIDKDLMNSVIEQEKIDKDSLGEFAESYLGGTND